MMSVGSGTVARRETGLSDPLLRRELDGPALVLARGLGLLFATLVLIMYARWLAHWLDLRLAAARHAARLPGGSSSYPEIAALAAVAAIGQAVAWGVLAGFVFWRRSRDLFGIFVAASFLSVGVMCTDLPVIVGEMRSDSWAPWSVAVILVANGLCVPWMFVFPDGRFVPRWTVVLGTIWFCWQVGRIFSISLDQIRLGPPAIVFNGLLVCCGVASVGYRYWRRSDAVQRQQLKL